MTTSWILTANSCEAHLYSAQRAKLLNGQANLALIGDFFHPESRLKTSELVEGKPGEYQVGKISSNRYGCGAYSQPTDPKQIEAEIFAKELADRLHSGWNNGDFEDLIVVASPGFLGLINKFIKNSPIEKVFSVSIEKDYTKMTPKQLANLLSEHL